MIRHTIRVARVIAGLGLIAIGAVLAIPGVPGPGLLVIFVGLTVLSSEFDWAHRLRERVHDAIRRVRGNHE